MMHLFHRRPGAALLVVVAFGFLLAGLAGCDPGGGAIVIVTQVVTRVVTDAPKILPTVTPRATGAAPSQTPEGSAAGSIDFVVPGDGQWEKTAGNGYAISGTEDTFAWSEQAVEGDFEFSADVESDFANYGEAMVVVYGDGEGWTPGCLIFNVTGYWQAIRANSIYDPEVEWVVQNEEHLDFENRSRYRMTIRVAGGEASLFVDDKLVASTPMYSHFGREGYLALVKYGGSAAVTFTNIEFRAGGAGETIAAAATETRAATVTPKNTPTPVPPPTKTLAPTAKPSPKPTSPPTATLPPPTAAPKPTSPPTATLPPPFRPPTGMLEDHAPGGQGELLIKNGTDADALVILTGLDDKAVKSAYIRTAESFNMTSIPDGTYRLYYSKGEAFNTETNRFARNATYQRLDATVDFTTSATQYTTWEVTLYGVAGGNVGSEQVDPADFP